MAKRKKQPFPPDLYQQIEVFLNEQRADILALDAILKTLITRLLPENAGEFFDEHEQQVLHSLSAYEPRARAQIEPRVVSFFEDLRQWYLARKAIPPSSGVH